MALKLSQVPTGIRLRGITSVGQSATGSEAKAGPMLMRDVHESSIDLEMEV